MLSDEMKSYHSHETIKNVRMIKKCCRWVRLNSMVQGSIRDIDKDIVVIQHIKTDERGETEP